MEARLVNEGIYTQYFMHHMHSLPEVLKIVYVPVDLMQYTIATRILAHILICSPKPLSQCTVQFTVKPLISELHRCGNLSKPGSCDGVAECIVRAYVQQCWKV
jgi:hypothetical protein